jgi:uncharacterized membrane protein (UPF0182 family)
MRRYQAGILIAIVALIVILVVLQGIANLFTNYLWFRSEAFDDVWRSMTITKLELEVFFTALFFAACWVSLLVVDRVAPRALFMSPELDFVRRYQTAVGTHRFAVRTIVSLVVAFAVGGGTGSQWQHWLLFLHGGNFGVRDPQFHKDVGYFVFKLPFLSFLVDWTQLALIVLAIVCVAAYYLNGGLRFTGPSPKVDPRATSHFSVIFAVLALLRAAAYLYVDRFNLDLGPNGTLFRGAGYTAIHVRLPAMNLLAIVALTAFAMFVYNVYARNWMLPIVAAGLWALVAFVVGVIFPAAVQLLYVNPAQSRVELPYVARNMTATRTAFSLNAVTQQPFQGNQDATPGVVAKYATSLADVDLWDPSVSSQTFQTLERNKGFYSINGLSMDRYELTTGTSKTPQVTPVVIGVREISTPNLNRLTWVNTHLVYTHGYGAVMASANSSSPTPNLVVQNIPVSESSGAPPLANPAVYYGVGETGYVVVDSRQAEYDYQSATGIASTRYTGGGGIRVGGFWQKAAFALKFHDFNLLVSNLVTPNSRIMFNQDVRTLVQKVAPFLQVDSHPYPVIVGGHIDWIVDAYTTTNSYPYAQTAVTSALQPGSGLQGSYNYVRNSVKAVVNAYTGQVTLYAMDRSDPILQAWERAFPGMVRPFSDMSSTLRSHLRYPQDLIQLEAAMFGKYHFSPQNPTQFFENGAAWQVAQTGTGQGAAVIQPVYQLLELPGSSEPTFSAFVPLVPTGGGRAQNLTAFMVANCSAAQYGALTAYEIPQARTLVPGPGIANATIAAFATVSAQTTLVDQHGSRATFGPTLLIPIDDSLLYVRSLFVTSSANSLPQLQYVVVAYGSNVGIAKTLLGKDGALVQVLGAAVGTVGPTGPVSIPTQIVNEIEKASGDEAAGYTALRAGDFGKAGIEFTAVNYLLKTASEQLAKLPKQPATSSKSAATSAGTTGPA